MKKKMALCTPIPEKKLKIIKEYCDITICGELKHGKGNITEEQTRKECTGNELIVLGDEQAGAMTIDAWAKAGMKFIGVAKGTPSTVDYGAIKNAGLELSHTPGRNAVAGRLVARRDRDRARSRHQQLGSAAVGGSASRSIAAVPRQPVHRIGCRAGSTGAPPVDGSNRTVATARAPQIGEREQRHLSQQARLLSRSSDASWRRASSWRSQFSRQLRSLNPFSSSLLAVPAPARALCEPSFSLSSASAPFSGHP